MSFPWAAGSRVVAPKRDSALNADAPRFQHPGYTDDHCLFLTFSNGFPLTESQIFRFFNSYCPLYVEDVYVHRPRTDGRMVKPSLFGKVMFKSANIPNVVMGPYDKVCIWIDGRPMHCRRFVSKKPNAAAFRDGSDLGGQS